MQTPDLHRLARRAIAALLIASTLPIESRTGAAAIFAPQSPLAPDVVSGAVYRDFDNNGRRDAFDTAIAGVAVTAYDATESAVASTATDATGRYTFTFGTTNASYRIEFVLPANAGFLQPGPVGPDSATTVRFVTGSSSNVDAEFTNPAQYCQADAPLIAPLFRNGLAQGGDPALVLVDATYENSATFASGVTSYFENAVRPLPTFATVGQVGTVWGLAGQSTPQQRLFASATLKRHAGLGPLGLDGVYIFDRGLGGFTASGGFKLSGASTTSGGLINLGTVTRTAGSSTVSFGDYDLFADPAQESVDLDAFDKVGKAGIGAIEMGEDGKTLWIVNMHDRALVKLDVNRATTSLQGAITTGVDQFLLDGLSGVPACTGGVFRPWALKIRDAVGYLGGVCSAETSQSTNDLSAHVLSFPIATMPPAFSQVLSFPLNYRREPVKTKFTTFGNPPIYSPGEWNAWRSSWALPAPLTPDSEGELSYPQPMFTDIEFSERGDLLLGFLDRFGMQSGVLNLIPTPGQAAGSQFTRTLFSGNTAGDTLFACKLASGGFAIEGTAGCTPAITGVVDRGGGGSAFQGTGSLPNTGELGIGGLPTGAIDGPSGVGEYFYQDDYAKIEVDDANDPPDINTSTEHNEVSSGALAVRLGSGQVVNAAFDPASPITTGFGEATRFAYTQGIHRYNTYAGTKINGFIIITSADGVADPRYSGKAGGLGDVEFACNPAPLEIGNRVWWDKNRDGLQTAGEPGVAGVEVHLENASGRIATVLSDIHGNYVFTRAIVQPNTAYTVTIDLDQTALRAGLSTLLVKLAGANAQGNATNNSQQDVRDSDATLVERTVPPGFARAGAVERVAFIAYTTGEAGANNHSLDFGVFESLASLGDRVWEDANRNGNQDAGEPDVPNVPVTLQTPNGDLQTTTSITGYYVFTSLIPGVPYTVVFGLPATYSFTLQTSGATTATDSNPDATGRTAAVVLTPDEHNPTIDAGIWRTAGLGDRVWLDTIRNGRQDSGESGVPGVTVQLIQDGGVARTTTTDATGLYRFDGLIPGVPYSVCFVPPPDRGWTAAFVGEATGDSNANIVSGCTPVVTLQSGEFNPTIDGGLVVMTVDPPSAVRLASLTAKRRADGSVLLQWSTLEEINTLAFNALRAPADEAAAAPPASAVQVSRQMIGALGSPSGGSNYSLIDAPGPQSQRFVYWLVEVEVDGRQNYYGPVYVSETRQTYLPMTLAQLEP